MPLTRTFNPNTSLARSPARRVAGILTTVNHPVVSGADPVRVEVPVTELDPNGTDVWEIDTVASDYVHGHWLDNAAGRAYLEIENIGSVTHTTTFITQVADIDGIDVEDRVVEIKAGHRVTVPLRPSTHNVRSGANAGRVYFNPSVQGELLYRAFRYPEGL